MGHSIKNCSNKAGPATSVAIYRPDPDGYISIKIDEIRHIGNSFEINLGHPHPSATVALKLRWTAYSVIAHYPIGAVSIEGQKAHISLFRTPPFDGTLVFESNLSAHKFGKGVRQC